LELGHTDRDERDIDLGDRHYLRYFMWHPDDLPANRETYGIPDGVPMPLVAKVGAMILHYTADGHECRSALHFDTPEVAQWNLASPDHRWRVVSWDPLSLEPSILCRLCGDHGFIRDGKWVRA
jgi:hypothetical protein